jgi:TolA-binding protein
MSRCRASLFAGGLAVSALALGCADGCDATSDSSSTAPTGSAPSASSGVRPLSPELKQKVLARVGDTEITLGEYAATLERMNEFERLRYQSPDRRKLLLEEMIEVELLAAEARRRGLDKLPETRARLRQVLRDELLLELRRELPKPEELPASEVRAYYDAHRAEFQEPERRRVAHLEVTKREKAEELLKLALPASAKEWGQLVRVHSIDRGSSTALGDPEEFAGDLGIVAAPGIAGGENPKVPEAVRKAVFEVSKIGAVYPAVVETEGSFHIVRLLGKTDARSRSASEADRAIRVRFLEARVNQLEEKVEQELRKKYPVVLDRQQLAKLKIPKRAP